MGWGGPAPPLPLRTQPDVDFFERPEESNERLPQMGGDTPAAPEVAMPELVGRSNHGATHGAVLMGALGPRQPVFGIDPHRESHVI